MSGRVRWMRDGKLITGYRKTDRRQVPRTPPSELPDFVLRALLPAKIAAFVSEGPLPGLIGAEITTPGPYLQVTGKNWRWVVEQACSALGAIAGSTDCICDASLKRPAKDNYEAVNRSMHLVYVAAASVVIPRKLDGPLIVPVKR